MKKKLALSSLASLSIRAIAMISAYVFMFLTIKYYGTEVWGLLSIATSVGILLTQVSKFGLDSTFLLIISENSKNPNLRILMNSVFIKILKRVIFIGLPLTIILYFTAPFLACHLFKNDSLSLYFRFISFTILPVAILLIISEGMKAMNYNIHYTILQNSSIYFFAVIVMIFIYIIQGFSTSDSYVPLISYLITTWILLVMSFFIYKSKSGFKFPDIFLNVDVNVAKRLKKLSINFFYTQLFIVIIGWLDTVLLGIFMSEKVVGLYNIALKFSFLFFLPLMTISSLIAPQVSEFYRNDRDRLRILIKNSSYILFGTTFLAAIFVLLSSEYIVSAMNVQILDIIYPMLILCVAQIINVLFGPNDTILQMTGNESVFMKAIGLAMVINILVDFLLIPKYGMVGAAIGNLIGLLVWNTICTIYLKRVLNIYSVTI